MTRKSCQWERNSTVEVRCITVWVVETIWRTPRQMMTMILSWNKLFQSHHHFHRNPRRDCPFSFVVMGSVIVSVLRTIVWTFRRTTTRKRSSRLQALSTFNLDIRITHFELHHPLWNYIQQTDLELWQQQHLMIRLIFFPTSQQGWRIDRIRTRICFYWQKRKSRCGITNFVTTKRVEDISS